MRDYVFNRLKREIDSSVGDPVLFRITDECLARTNRLELDQRILLDEEVGIETKGDCINIRQSGRFGIYWTFDSDSGDLTDT